MYVHCWCSYVPDRQIHHSQTHSSAQECPKCIDMCLGFSPNNMADIHQLTLQWMYCHSLQSNLSTPRSSHIASRYDLFSQTQVLVCIHIHYDQFIERLNVHIYLILSQHIGLSFL